MLNQFLLTLFSLAVQAKDCCECCCESEPISIGWKEHGVLLFGLALIITLLVVGDRRRKKKQLVDVLEETSVGSEEDS
ncbi:MAG: hypothetical protein ABIJ23_03870 [Candidatus Magasanikbacteria bacterium]